jgi:adenine phosphoribosyltransferase
MVIGRRWPSRKIRVRIPTEAEIKYMVKRIDEIFRETKLSRLKARLMASELLRLLKPSFSYWALSILTDIPESVLCRYVRGSIIPSYEQAINVLAKISLSIDLDYLLRDLVEKEKSTIIDLSRVLKDPYVIRLLTIILLLELAGKNITKIVATAQSVLPLATMLGLELNTPIVLVKRRAYPGVQYYSAIIVRSPKESETLYLDKDLISRRDNVLILADVVYTGKTLSGVISLLERARAKITDIIVILALGEKWRERLSEYTLKTLTKIPYPST